MQKTNFSTGPVNITREVSQALAEFPISHRSKDFNNLYYNTTDFLCEQLRVKKTFLLSGSGTAANEAMILQIKELGCKGLILSNGEFGLRLVQQAARASLEFAEYRLSWGERFDVEKIESLIKQQAIGWILFCHCETSTGVLNDLEAIAVICARNNCLCFADCMSTVGTADLDLSNIAMATASSGKGPASIPGLATVFSNIDVVSSNNIPVYFDLGYYAIKENIPFTISSNLVNALNVSARQKLQRQQFELIEQYAERCFQFLNQHLMLPFNNDGSKVFTISPSDSTNDFVNNLSAENITLSYESDYLKKRNWCQLALFGYYQQKDLEHLLTSLQTAISVISV